MSVVQFHLWPPQFNQIYQYLTWFIGSLILCTKKVLQGSTSCILGYKPSTKFYISSTKCLHPHHPYRDPPPLCSLGCTLSPPKLFFLIFPHKRYLHYSKDPAQRKSKAIAEHSKYFSFQNRAVLNTMRAHLYFVIKIYFYYKHEHN